MKRTQIVSRLIKEGFSEKTLLTFSDRQLSTLHNRMVSENTKMIPKEKTPEIEMAKKNKETFVAYEAELKGGQKKLDKNKNGKLDSEDFKILRSKKTEMSEEKPSAGLTKEKKSEIVKKAKKGEDIGKKGKGFKEIEKSAKKGGAKDPKAVAAAAMWKNIKREQVEVSNWVNKLAEQNFHSFTSKNEIMELIKNKLNEQEVGAKVKRGHNNVPEFMTYDSIMGSTKEVETPTKPKTKPSPTTPEKLPVRRRIWRPDDDEETTPKASMGESKTKEVETPTKPKTKPSPTTPEKLPVRRRIWRPDDDEETTPKAKVKESIKKK